MPEELSAEVVGLAIGPVATSCSGYVAARWDGQESLLYGHASADRFRVTTTAIALALAGYTTVAMLALPRI